MRRCRFGAGLLTGLLLLGIFANLWASRRYTRLSLEIARAEELVLQENPEGTAHALRRCRENWDRYRLVTAALVDHQRLDRVDTLFRQLDFALFQGDTGGIGDLCAQLSRELEAMAREHSLSWENIL